MQKSITEFQIKTAYTFRDILEPISLSLEMNFRAFGEIPLPLCDGITYLVLGCFLIFRPYTAITHMRWVYPKATRLLSGRPGLETLMSRLTLVFFQIREIQ